MRERRRVEAQRFCSLECGSHGRTKTPVRAIVYFHKATGRWYVRCRDGSRMLYARAVMAGQLGRLLRPDEQVHHRNEDPADDRPSNLQVVTRSEHARLHGAGKWAKR